MNFILLDAKSNFIVLGSMENSQNKFFQKPDSNRNKKHKTKQREGNTQQIGNHFWLYILIKTL